MTAINEHKLTIERNTIETKQAKLTFAPRATIRTLVLVNWTLKFL